MNHALTEPSSSDQLELLNTSICDFAPSPAGCRSRRTPDIKKHNDLISNAISYCLIFDHRPLAVHRIVLKFCECLGCSW